MCWGRESVWKIRCVGKCAVQSPNFCWRRQNDMNDHNFEPWLHHPIGFWYFSRELRIFIWIDISNSSYWIKFFSDLIFYFSIRYLLWFCNDTAHLFIKFLYIEFLLHYLRVFTYTESYYLLWRNEKNIKFCFWKISLKK